MPKIDSPLLLDKTETIEKPKYSTLEEEYLGGLRRRMMTARNARDQEHEEFDGMSYTQNYEMNERVANTFIAPKKNKEDTNFQSGTVRTKLFALLSALVNLNLSGDISAFDKEGLKIQALGDAMEDVILKTNELDVDDEKKYLRHYELLKHGTVFVEELWDEKQKKEKKMKGKYDGKIKQTWDEKIKKAFARPARNIVPGINLYLGDITKYDISEQPFVVTVDTVPYQEAKMIFGEWERWKSVPKKLVRTDSADSKSLQDWTLLQSQENYVEILRYQDKWNNEFAVLLNGVLMTPVGYPLPWGYEEYNIAQQNLEPINSKFAYGKSLVSRIRNKVALLDEFERLAILKTQKSFAPPRYNLSGRIVSNRVFMPGKMNYGIPPNSFPPLEGENTGVTQAEFNMIKEIQESINTETTSPIFQGQQGTGDQTATEIIELQRQAKMILGLTVFSVSMLEWKLEWLRLKNLLANWFNAEDQVVDEARGLLKSKFRQTSVDRSVEGEGMGRRIVIPTKEPMPSPQAIMKSEDALSQEQGVPVRLIFLNPDEITNSKLIWQIVIKPKERKTSEVSKLLFRAFMQDVIPLQPNMAYLQERMASVWEENPQKLFAPNPAPPMPAEGVEGQGGSKTVSPRVNLPSPEKATGQQLNKQLQTA